MEGFKNKLHKSDIQKMLSVGDLIRKKKSSIEELALGLRLDNGVERSAVEAEFCNSKGQKPLF